MTLLSVDQYTFNNKTYAKYTYLGNDTLNWQVTGRPFWPAFPDAGNYPAYITGASVVYASTLEQNTVYDSVFSVRFRNFSGVTVDLTPGADGFGTGPNNSKLRNVSMLVGSNGTDNLKGDSSSNVIFGGAGNDRIDGSGGADTLYGDLGDDTFFTGWDRDSDTVDGGAGIDQIWSGNTDTVAGGTEKDLFFFDWRQFGTLVTDNVATYTITDFKHGEDKIVIAPNKTYTIDVLGGYVNVADTAGNTLAIHVGSVASQLTSGDFIQQ